MKLHPNPDYRPWTPETQRDYFVFAYQKYRAKFGDPRPPQYTWWDRYKGLPEPTPHKVKRDYVKALYNEGCALGSLRCTLEEFLKFLREGEPRRRYKKGHHYIDPQGKVIVKPSSKYRKPKGTVRNNRTVDQVKVDWRAEKGFDRDRRKSRWKRSAPQFYRQKSASERRAFEQRMIHREDWENYLTEVNHDWVNKWDWD